MSDCEQFAQIAQDKWATVSDRSGRSEEMSDREWITQVAHDKWANEQFALKFLAKKI